MIQLILACIAISLFIAYNATTIGIFGLPCSLSNTYYMLNEKWKGSGIAFTIMMISMAALLLYPWMYVTFVISSWSMYLGILPFLTCVLIMFVGAAPQFRQDKYTEETHYAGAFGAAGCALLWVCIVCWQIAYIIPIWILVCGGIAHLTKTARSSRDWLLEMCAFGPTFTAIIAELAMHL